MERGGNMPCVLNAANEIVVAEFLKDRIGFLEMSDVVEKCLSVVSFVSKPSLEDYVETDAETRRLANQFIA
jgi:1-deoxy-D-xylulose-5-phosphate reductoisomerase